ncbi:PREDICTED: receptor-binding cancer antigen expressed on SiSo cells isoform X3 [Calidris pugnax]|uniref:receptor-binding cancer antigen expressed on SiSo cells isoform X3 n=1 Tax=Calidris pugnax TaxID=198806 RepID=UPI00071CA82E|nr:PREDICTED: receptor-binding cancer antigen expressed on SiSo cells isoform X3 [Calidris pugnax]
MAITQFRLFKICTCLAAVLSFIKKLICRSGRGRKLSGDQITLPTTVDYSSVPKQPEVEDWSSWDEDAPTSVKIEGGNGNVAAQQNPLEQMEPDYFKDMTPTIRKTQKIVIKKREPLNFGIPEGNTGFSSRLAATQDIPFIHQSLLFFCFSLNWETWILGKKILMPGKKRKMLPGRQKKFLDNRR